MNRKVLTRGLAWCVVALMLLPLSLAVVLGLGGLLAALGDEAAAALCSRVALGLGGVFTVVVVATTTVNAMMLLVAPRRHRRRRRRQRRAFAPPPDRGTGTS